MENSIIEIKLNKILKNQEEIKEKVSEIDEIKKKVLEIDEIKKKVSEIDEIKKKVSEIDEIKEKVNKIDNRVMIMEEEYLKKIQLALNGLAMHIETHQSADKVKNILLNHEIRIEALEENNKR